MAHRHKAHHRAKGGRMSFVNAPTEKEAGDKKDSFKRGGRHHVGKAHGHKSKARADKRARGGGVTHSPFSSAAKGNDMKRRPGDRDGHQPRADGGRTGYARGGRMAGMGGKSGGGKTRPGPFAKSAFNFGAHAGQGHEEPAMTHPPVSEKHGGVPHHRKTSGHHQAGHGAHHAHHPHHDGHHSGHHGVHGSHKAKGKKHRKDGGKVDEKEEKEDGEEDEPESGGCGYKRGGALTEVSKHTSKGGLHRSLGIPEGQKIGAKRIKAAEHSSNPKTRKQAELAETYAKHRPH